MTRMPSAPASAAAWAISAVSPARMAPAPISAGPRPAAARTVIAARSRRSGRDIAQNSPVQPPATMPVAPAANSRSILAAKASSSIDPPRNGVVMAGIGPDQSMSSRSIMASLAVAVEPPAILVRGEHMQPPGLEREGDPRSRLGPVLRRGPRGQPRSARGLDDDDVLMAGGLDDPHYGRKIARADDQRLGPDAEHRLAGPLHRGH